MRIIDLRGKRLTRAEMLAAMPRAEMGTKEATDLVRPILDDVRDRGAAALRDFEEKFDHVRPEHLRVPAEAMKQALDELDPEVRAAIEESVRRSRAVSSGAPKPPRLICAFWQKRQPRVQPEKKTAPLPKLPEITGSSQ